MVSRRAAFTSPVLAGVLGSSGRAARAALLAACAFTAACAGAAPEAPEGASTEGAQSVARIESGATASFKGSFSVRLDGAATKIEFTVSRIDWTAGTARWDAKVAGEAEGGRPADVDVPIAIRTLRCPGCFVFRAEGEGETPLAVLGVRDGRLGSIDYTGLDATKVKVTAVEATPPPETGSCSIVCTAGVYRCKDEVTKAECKASLFDEVPRCPHTFEFNAGARCEPR